MRPGGGSYAHLDEAELVALFRARDAGAVRHVATCHNQRLFRAAWAVLRIVPKPKMPFRVLI